MVSYGGRVRQQLLWIPRGESSRGSIPWDGERPTLVWTLHLEKDETKPPEFPFQPVHRQNAFLEDLTHDWIVRGGTFSYFSRVIDLRQTGVWLLLEWKS